MRCFEKSKDMIIDSSVKSLLMFAIPLLMSNIFQQLYTVIDSLIVGNYLGKAELAAVGTTGTISFFGIGIFTGIATGAGVVIGNYYGAGDKRKLKESVHTSIAFGIIGGALLSILGVLFAEQVLIWMHTPKEVLPYATIYQQIYFAGLVFAVIYNMGTGILRAEGDSNHPLNYLIVTTILNIVLDIIMICVLEMGIAGAALATVISEAVSAVMVMYHLCKLPEPLNVKIKEIRMYKDVVGKVIGMGIPTGVQTGVIALSNIIVQSFINQFGVDAVSGCSIFIKIDGFIVLPITSFGLVAMTFTSQNIGTGKVDILKAGERKIMAISVGYTIVVTILLELFAGNLIGLFNGDPGVIEAGCKMLRILVPGYWMLAVTHVFVGMFRGSGKSLLAMMVMLINLVVLRIAFLVITVPMIYTLETVLWSYTITWITSIASSVFFRYKIPWKRVWEEEAGKLQVQQEGFYE